MEGEGKEEGKGREDGRGKRLIEVYATANALLACCRSIAGNILAGQRKAKDLLHTLPLLTIHCSSEADKKEADVPLWWAVLLV